MSLEKVDLEKRTAMSIKMYSLSVQYPFRTKVKIRKKQSAKILFIHSPTWNGISFAVTDPAPETSLFRNLSKTGTAQVNIKKL